MEEHIDPKWRKSTRSGNGGGSCIEVGQEPGRVLVRDTKQEGTGPVLRVGADVWKAFTTSLK